MKIKKVMVVGSGLMGSGIAQVCAQAGVDLDEGCRGWDALHDLHRDFCSDLALELPDGDERTHSQDLVDFFTSI